MMTAAGILKGINIVHKDVDRCEINPRINIINNISEIYEELYEINDGGKISQNITNEFQYSQAKIIVKQLFDDIKGLQFIDSTKEDINYTLKEVKKNEVDISLKNYFYEYKRVTDETQPGEDIDAHQKDTLHVFVSHDKFMKKYFENIKPIIPDDQDRSESEQPFDNMYLVNSIEKKKSTFYKICKEAFSDEPESDSESESESDSESDPHLPKSEDTIGGSNRRNTYYGEGVQRPYHRYNQVGGGEMDNNVSFHMRNSIKSYKLSVEWSYYNKQMKHIRKPGLENSFKYVDIKTHSRYRDFILGLLKSARPNFADQSDVVEGKRVQSDNVQQLNQYMEDYNDALETRSYTRDQLMGIAINYLDQVIPNFINISDILCHTMRAINNKMLEASSLLNTSDLREIDITPPGKKIVSEPTPRYCGPERKIKEWEGQTGDRRKDSLITVLRNEGAYQAFKSHLEDEFSFENIAFLEQVQKYRKTYDDMSNKLAKLELNAIYDEFIADDAPQEVNIKSAHRSTLRENLQSKNPATEPSVLNGAELEVYEMIQGDAFARFKTKNHPAYHAAVEEAVADAPDT